ncbi:hypothetical protein K458DRAFT_119039 [Lentithecium fluviatile CBS 122367]|uniref:Uncharacterized protein n=1 Tax=Lentithecium fluviatile CBS 122367 TaxID=1168545 RepID=A0A6G1IM33_9PLEO|nr:hypothetical protein K458DRAFT_119039 [Lentithecium fluviatile CBS 122367]
MCALLYALGRSTRAPGQRRNNFKKNAHLHRPSGSRQVSRVTRRPYSPPSAQSPRRHASQVTMATSGRCSERLAQVWHVLHAGLADGGLRPVPVSRAKGHGAPDWDMGDAEGAKWHSVRSLRAAGDSLHFELLIRIAQSWQPHACCVFMRQCATEFYAVGETGSPCTVMKTCRRGVGGSTCTCTCAGWESPPYDHGFTELW